MTLTPGTRLKSAVCETEAVVVRVPAGGEVGCGGAPMIAMADPRPDGGTLDPAFAAGSQLGKRYHDADSGLEMLCTKGGAGSIAIDGRALLQRDAKQLPSSD